MICVYLFDVAIATVMSAGIKGVWTKERACNLQ